MLNLNAIFSSKNYYYFDQYDQLQTKQLNFIQRFFRKAFKFYAETHLLNVAHIGYRLTLKKIPYCYSSRIPCPQCTVPLGEYDYKQVQHLFQIIEKVNKVYPNNNRYFFENNTISVLYNIKKSSNNDSNDDYTIHSVDLKINNSENISFIRQVNGLDIHLPLTELILDNEKTQLINDLVRSILNDMTTKDYYYYPISLSIPYNNDEQNKLIQNLMKSTSFQKKANKPFSSFPFLNLPSTNNEAPPPFSSKLIYEYESKKNINQSNQNFSLNFALLSKLTQYPLGGKTYRYVKSL